MLFQSCFSGSCDFGFVFSLFFHVLRAASWILFYGNGGAQARVFGCFLRGLTIHVGSASSGGTCGAGHEIFLELARDIFISLKIARTPLPSFPRAILRKLKVCDFVHGAASLRIARAGYSQRMLMTRASLRFLSWLMVLCYRLL